MSTTEDVSWLSEKIDVVHNLPQISKPKKCLFRIYIISITANLLCIANGFIVNWVAPVLPKLLSNDTNLNPLGREISTVETSILAGSPYFTGLLGFVFMAKISDWIGRRKTMLYSAVVNVISFNVIAFSYNIYIYYICFLLLGASLAGVYVSVPIYNAEISDKYNRSRLGNMVGLGTTLGILASFVIGSITSVQVFTIINSIPALIYLLLAHFIIVESPVYLCLRGKKNEALKTLKILRENENQHDIEKEYLDISSNIRQSDENKNSIIDLFKTKASKKALFVSIFLCTGQQTSGVSAIVTFVGIIFQDAGFTLTANTIGIFLGCEQALIIMFITYLVRWFDRKYLLLFSCLMASFSIFVLSFCLFLKQINSDLIDHVRWLPAGAAFVFMAGYSVGYGPIPTTLCGELFSNNLRSIGVGLSMLIECLVTFLVKFSFPLLSKCLGVHFTLLIYGVLGLVNFIVFYVFLPKTKGRTLKEIQEIMEK